MTPDVIEKKGRHHDDLAVTVNDAAPCHLLKLENLIIIPFCKKNSGMYLKLFFSQKLQFHFQRNESGKTRAKGEPTYGHIQQ